MADLTPSAIVRELDQHVIGQNDAKKTLAVAVYWHYRKSDHALMTDAVELTKSNVLLIGSTGTGKTLLCETLSHILGVPFVTADAASLAQTQYVAREIEAILQRLVDKAGGDVARAQRGVVFIDEIDKLKAISGTARASGESVQHALLKIMEGSQVRLPDGVYIDTTHILFICGGAFVGIEEILRDSQVFGFLSFSGKDNPGVLKTLNARVKPGDLREFGLIPEFAGRLPIVARLDDLSKDALARILIEPRQSIYNQFRSILAADGVELAIERVVFEQIAELALEYKAGARSLRGIFEGMMTDVLYTVADDKAIRRVSITSLFDLPRYER